MNQLNEVNATEITDTSNLVKKLTITQKLLKLKRKILDHDYRKHITIHKFNKLTADNFAARLAQAKSATKDDIADFVKKKQNLITK